MPRGTRNGTDDELATAYIHGRIDATREILIEEIDRKLDRELNHWCYRFSLNPVEIKQNLGAVSVAPQADSLPSPGMQYAAQQRKGHAVATLEVVERTHGVRSSLGSGSGDSQDAPGEIEPAPAKRKHSSTREYWASMTPKQKAAVMRDKVIATSKKRKLLPIEKKRLATLTRKAAGTVAPKGAKQATEQPATKRGRPRIINTAPPKAARQRGDKQRLYQARHMARKLGLPLPPLPGQITSPVQATAVAH